MKARTYGFTFVQYRALPILPTYTLADAQRWSAEEAYQHLVRHEQGIGGVIADLGQAGESPAKILAHIQQQEQRGGGDGRLSLLVQKAFLHMGTFSKSA